MTSQTDLERGRYTKAEDEYIVWAVRHGGGDREIAYDLRRSIHSVRIHIRALKEKHNLPDRRQINSGRKGKGKW